MTRSFLVNRGVADEPSYSQAVAVGGEIFVSGQIAQDHPDWQGRHGTIEEETAASLDLCARMLADGGATLTDVVKVTIFMTDLAEFDRMTRSTEPISRQAACRRERASKSPGSSAGQSSRSSASPGEASDAVW